MNWRKVAVAVLACGFFAGGAQAQIKHVEMRVEGMT